MAEFIAIECRQCGEVGTFHIDQFTDLLKQAENTRINLADSGSLNLSLYLCDYCLSDDDEEADTAAPAAAPGSRDE